MYVHVTLVVSDAHLLADMLVRDTSNEVDKVVRGGISSVSNAAPTLRLSDLIPLCNSDKLSVLCRKKRGDSLQGMDGHLCQSE